MNYIVCGQPGGCGTNFLLNLIAHSALSYPKEIIYPVEGHAHNFTMFLRQEHLKLKLSGNGSIYDYRFVDPSISPIILTGDNNLDIDDVKKYLPDFKVAMISVSPKYRYEVEVNHFLKNFAQQPTTFSSDYHALHKSLNLPPVKKYLRELPQSDMKKMIDIQANNIPFEKEYSKEDRKYIHNISYGNLMYNMEYTLQFVENITGKVRTEELVKSAKNYYEANAQLREKYSLLYPKY